MMKIKKSKRESRLVKKFSLLLIFSIILTLGLSISMGSLLAAWTSPANTPPDGNIAAPINISTTGQSKQGGLILNTGGSTNGLIVQSGNVGIGTTNPQAMLDVAGNIIASDPTANNHLATKGYVDALGISGGGEYVQGNATYFTAGGNNYYCSQRVVSLTGVVTISNVNEGQPCDTGKVCNSGQCSSPGESATTCTTNSQCASGYCVDGYCCNTACSGACQACNIFGSAGICTNVPDGTDPANECATTTCTNYIYGSVNPTCYRYATNTSKNGTCNGGGACYSSLTDICSGQGTATITCGSTGCWKACTANSLVTSYDNYNEVCYTDGTAHGCSSGLVCDSTGTCKLPASTACTADSQCGSGYLCGVDADGDRYLTTATTGTCVLGVSHTDCYDSDARCTISGTNSYYCTAGTCKYCRWVKSYDCGNNYYFNSYITMTCSPTTVGSQAGMFSRYGNEGTWTSLYGGCVYYNPSYSDAAQYICSCN